jgi:glutathione S-transferase
MQGFTPHAPSGKIPYISLEGGESIGDSTLCYRYLQKHRNVPDVDVDLTPEECALSVSHKAWLEEWCYFLLLWDRYVENPRAVKEGFFRNALPPRYRPFTGILFVKVRGYIKKSLHLQGVSRHTKEEIISFIEEAARSLSVLVGEKGLLEGRAMSANAYAFGLLVTVYNGPQMCSHWFKELQKYPNLRAWTERMAEKYFPGRKVLAIDDVGGNGFLKSEGRNP